MKNKYLIKFILPAVIFWGLTLNTVYSQTMKVKSGTNITIQQGTTLKCAGGSLLLEDDYNSSPSFLERGSLEFNNPYKAYIQQYLEKDEWHLVSQPTTSAQIGTYLWIFLYQWQEPTGTYQYLNLPVTIPMNVGEGYWAKPYTYNPPYPASPDSVMFRGTLNDSDIFHALSYTPSSPGVGWNVVGNPFPCAVNYNGDASWNLTNMDNTIYFFDGSTGGYATWNWLTGIGTNGKHNGYIPATQGFLVKANASGASITFPASQRIHSDTTEFFKSSFPGSILRLIASDGSASNEAVIAFTPDATSLFDTQLDGYFMNGFDQKLSLYTVHEGKEYTVNMLPSVEEQHAILLNFECNQPGECSITFSGMETFESETPVFLEDKLLNQVSDMRVKSVYTFYNNPENDPARFVVHFSNPLGESELPESSQVQIFAADQSVHIIMPENQTGVFSIFDHSGKEIQSGTVFPGLNSTQIDRTNGIYTIKVISGQNVDVRKVFIK